MRKFGIALVFAVVMAGAALTVEAKSLYFIAHFNEGSNTYSYIKTDYTGCVNHLTNHSSDYIYTGSSCLQ